VPPRTSWRDLLPGLLALAVVVSSAIGIMMFAGIGRLRGKTIHIFLVTNQARGVIPGTEVWLEGQKVGVVDRIDFRAPSADTGSRVVIVMSVRVKDAGQIRRDSPAQVRIGGSIVGPVVVYIDAGNPRSPAARHGDTLRGPAQSDLQLAGVKANVAMDQIGPLIADAKTVIAHARNPNGTIGAAMAERGGGEVARLRAQMTRLREHMFRGGGGGAKSRAGIATHARSALARVDSIRGLLKSPSSSFGRFRRDSTLGATVADVRDELARLRSRFAESEGTLGRLGTDSAVTRAIADAQREMALLFDDIRRRPSRYIVF